jgi:hypothetical protein
MALARRARLPPHPSGAAVLSPGMGGNFELCPAHRLILLPPVRHAIRSPYSRIVTGG